MTTNKMKEWIEPYLLGELDPAQQQLFEQAAAADTALMREVERLRAVVGALERRGETPAREALLRLGSEQQLRDIIRKAQGGEPARRSLRLSRIAGVCTAVAAAVALIVWVGRMPEYSSKTLFDSYFIAHQHFEVTPSRGGEGEDMQLDRGLELLRAGHTDAAIELLQPLAQDDEAELQDAARWNLALALLRQRERHRAVVLLDELIAAKSEFSAKATELKTKITKRRWF